jgi:DNA-binding LacI/PurR family transcriptional regulator
MKIFEWFCRKRINGLIAMNKMFNRNLQEVCDENKRLRKIIADHDKKSHVSSVDIENRASDH